MSRLMLFVRPVITCIVLCFLPSAYAQNPGEEPVLAVLSLTAPDAEAAETLAGEAVNKGHFVITRTGNLEVAITVRWGVAGSAIAGVDYQAIQEERVMPAGRARIEIPIRPIDDHEVEGEERVVVYLLPSPCEEIPSGVHSTDGDCYRLGEHNEAVVRIVDNDEPSPLPMPIITVRTLRGEVTEGEAANESVEHQLSFVLNRHENIHDETVVQLSWHGTATRGLDYQGAPEQVVFPPGASEKVVRVSSLQDELVEGDETVVLRIVSIQCLVAEGCYLVGHPGEAVGIIRDDDRPPDNQAPVVEWMAPPPGSVFVQPDELRLATAAIDRDGEIRRVTFLANGVPLGTVTDRSQELDAFAGAPETSLYQWIWNDPAPGEYQLQAEAEDDEGAITRSPGARVLIRTGPHHALSVVSVVATDREAVEPGDPAGHEVNIGLFRVRREGNLQVPLDVFYHLEGSATNGEDYAGLEGVAHFAEHQAEVEIRVVPLADNLREEPESVHLSLIPVACPEELPLTSACYRLGTPAADRVMIFDARLPENRPPVTQLVNPWHGQDFRAGADIRLVAEAWDFDGTVVQVEFFSGEHSLGLGNPAIEPGIEVENSEGLVAERLSHPRYTLTWTNVPAGRYVLHSAATDDAGAVGRSRRVEIKVVEMGHPSVVTIEATDPLASESPLSSGDPDVAEFVVHRTGDTNVPLRVYLQLGGSATPGEDYHGPDFPGVIIPSGARTARLRLVPVDDDLPEGPEVIEVGIVPPRWLTTEDGGNLLPIQYVVGEPARAHARLLDNDVPATNLTPRVRLVRPEVHATFEAPAQIGLSVEACDLDGRIVTVEFFANGQSVGSLPGVSENLERTTYSLVWQNVPAGMYELHATATDNHGAVGHSQGVLVQVTEHPLPPIVEIFAVDPRAREGGVAGAHGAANNARFRVRRNRESGEALTVYYSVSGSADNGVDYHALSGEVIIPAGRLSQVIEVVPLADNEVEPEPETVVLTIHGGDGLGYIPGRRHEAAAFIVDAWRSPPERGSGLRDGEVLIVLPTEIQGLVSVQVSFNLVDWTHICTIPTEGGFARFVDPEARQIGRRFYQMLPAEILLEDLDD